MQDPFHMPYARVNSPMLRTLIFIISVCALLMPCWTANGAPSPSPTNVLLARGRTEPVVAVDPRNPSIVVASANTNYSAPVGSTFPTAFYWSSNGGKSFGHGTMLVVPPYTTAADTTVAVSGDGTAFYSYLGETPTYCSGGRSAIVITHSIDHGRSYRQPVVVDANPDDDKPNMVIRTVAGGRTHLFVTWTRWHGNTSDIWFSRSLDGGSHFTAPAMLHSSRLDNFGSVPAAGPNGRVYVFWSIFPEESLGSASPTRVVMKVSTDEGRHFGPLVNVSPSFRGVPRMTQPGSLRNFTMPAVAVDRKGAISVAWSQVSTVLSGGAVNSDIVLSRSSDNGRSWSTPTRLNDSRKGDRFMPALTAWPDGSLGVAFYDRRSNPNWLDVYAARVSTVPRTVASPNVRLNARRSPISKIFYIRPGSTCFSPGRFFGDYIGAASAPGGMLNVVWADTQLQVYNETDIWFSRIRLAKPKASAQRSRNARDGGL